MDKTRKSGSQGHAPRSRSRERFNPKQRYGDHKWERPHHNYRGRNVRQYSPHNHRNGPRSFQNQPIHWSYDRGRYFDNKFDDTRNFHSQQWNDRLYMPFSSDTSESHGPTEWYDDRPPHREGSGDFNSRMSWSRPPPPLLDNRFVEPDLNSRSIFDAEPADVVKNISKPPPESTDKETVDSHSLELSLKATSIIDSILKGEKAPIKRPEKKQNTKGKDEDIIEKAKKICQENRRIREARLLATTESIGGISLGRSNSVLGSSTKSTMKSKTPARSTITTSSTTVNVTSSSSATLPIRTSESPKRYPRIKKSIPLKESVLKMIKYPKSRRGTSQIDKLLKKTAAPLHSKQRLLSLMQPEDPNMNFTHLAPDVQKDILSLIDEVMVDFTSDDYISLSDDDRSDLASPQARSRQSSLTESINQVRSDSTQNVNDVLPDDDWRDILSSAGFDGMNDYQTADDNDSGDHGNLLVANFPPSMNEGLRIVDRVIGEKKFGLADKSQKQMKSLTDINDENFSSGFDPVSSTASKSCSSEILGQERSLSSPHRNKRFSLENNEESASVNRSEQGASQLASKSIINDADIICIKPEPSQQGYENDVIEIIDEDHDELDIPESMGSVPSINQKEKETVSTHSSSVHLSDSIMKDVHDEDDSSSKPGSKRPRNPSTPEKTSDAPSASSDSLVAKRPKVNESETDTSAMMEEIYNITMEEEEVRDKMVDTDKVIHELMDSLQIMKERRKKLEEEEILLRKRRLDILRGAKLAQRSSSNTSRRDSIERYSNDEKANSASESDTTCVEAGKTLVEINNSAEVIPKLPVESSSDQVRLRKISITSIGDASDGDVDVKMEPDTTVHCAAPMETSEITQNEPDNPINETTNASGEPEHQSMSGKDSLDNDESSKDPLGNCVLEKTPMSLQYLGSFTAEANVQSILKQLTKNFSNLKQVTSVMLDDGEKLDLSRKPSNNCEPVDEDATAKQPSPDTSSSPFKIPESPPPDSVQSTVKTKKSSSPEKQSKKNKSKKKKSQSKSDSSMSSDDDEVMKSSKSKRSPKKVKKDKATSKIMKEYLHCSSSTDVEMSGLESKTSSLSATTKQGRKSAGSYDSDSAGDVEKQSKASVPSKKVMAAVYLEVLSGPINCMVAWKRNLLVTGGDFKIKYLSKSKPDHISTMSLCRHKGHVKFLHVSALPDATTVYVYSGGADKTIQISNLKKAKYVAELPCPAAVSCGTEGWGKIYVGLANGMIIIVEQNRIEKTYQAASKDHGILAIAAGQEGTRKILAYTEQNEQAITVRDARNNLFIRCLEGHRQAPSCLKIKHHQVYSGGADNMVQIHNIVTGTMETLLRFQSNITQLLVDKWLIVGEERGVIDIIETKHHARLHVIYTRDHSPVTALVFDNSTCMLYVGEATGQLEAVPLNNRIHVCQFAACKGYSFGDERYMLHHILADHVEPCLRGSQHARNMQKPNGYKCLWKGCDKYVETKMKQHLVSQDPLYQHIASHVHEEFSCTDVQILMDP